MVLELFEHDGARIDLLSERLDLRFEALTRDQEAGCLCFGVVADK